MLICALLLLLLADLLTHTPAPYAGITRWRPYGDHRCPLFFLAFNESQLMMPLILTGLSAGCTNNTVLQPLSFALARKAYQRFTWP